MSWAELAGLVVCVILALAATDMTCAVWRRLRRWLRRPCVRLRVRV